MPSWGRGIGPHDDNKKILSFPLESAIYQPLKLKAKPRNLYSVTHGPLFRWRRKGRFSTGDVLSAASAIDHKRTNCRFKVIVFFYLSFSLDLKRIQVQSVCLFLCHLSLLFSFANGTHFKEQASDLSFFIVFVIVIHFLSLRFVFALIFYFCYIHSRAEGFFPLVFLI